MVRPQRMQLSRQAGFNLQAASQALNWLPARSSQRCPTSCEAAEAPVRTAMFSERRVRRRSASLCHRKRIVEGRAAGTGSAGEGAVAVAGSAGAGAGPSVAGGTVTPRRRNSEAGTAMASTLWPSCGLSSVTPQVTGSAAKLAVSRRRSSLTPDAGARPPASSERR